MKDETLLIIDDEPDMLLGIKRLLSYDLPKLHVETCTDPAKAADLARRFSPDAVLLDVRMPKMDGLTVLSALKEIDPMMTCIMMTAYGTIELAVDAMKAGAYDFITKPFEKEVLFRVLNKALERSRLIKENRVLRGRVGQTDFHSMIGRSPLMQQLFGKIRAIARSDYSVLIRGESGTGKELVARALHAESRRSRRNLVIVNCPAIPGQLLESELFGHRRGAFTGADRDQKGLFEEADGGTIFLDEVADIPVDIQTKLLRALQDGEIKPLGTVKPIKLDVRVIAATNQDLEEKIRNRTFREDLFYRLNVMSINTPNLADIPEDIPLLVNHFASMASNEVNLPRRQFSPEALKLMAASDWPGNVRQLQNFIRQAVIFSDSEIISEDQVRAFMLEFNKSKTGSRKSPAPGQNVFDGTIKPYHEEKERVIEEFSRSYIENLLKKTGGNVSKSAEMSGLGRASLQKILRRLNINADWYR